MEIEHNSIRDKMKTKETKKKKGLKNKKVIKINFSQYFRFRNKYQTYLLKI